LGDAVAVLLEAPLMLAVSWKLSKWTASKHGLLSDPGGALLMGAIAFAVLMLAESSVRRQMVGAIQFR